MSLGPLNVFIQAFDGFNSVPDKDTEKMVQFHIFAANTQLRQAYYGFIAAMGLERSLVMPRVRMTGHAKGMLDLSL